MATPIELLWERKPHTAAKHRILRKYLEAWMPILASKHRRIVYIDGFAGPGEYLGGEPASPFIALEVARKHVNEGRIKSNVQIVFGFIEERKDRYEHLCSIVSNQHLPDQFILDIKRDEFDGFLSDRLDELTRERKAIAPTFAFVDPFGFEGLPMKLLHRLLKRDRTEVFANFSINSVNRFKSDPRKSIHEHVKGLFGREVAEIDWNAENAFDQLRQLYEQGLQEAAEFVRSFEMYRTGNQPIYDLFFATNNSLGHERMKEAMWSVAPEGDFRFTDATHNQTALFHKEPGPQLIQQILSEFKEEEDVQAGEVKDWAVDTSGFIRKHVGEALEIGKGRGDFRMHEVKANGKKYSHGFPDDARLNFKERGTPNVIQRSLFS